MLRLEFASASSLGHGFDTGGQPLVVMPFIDPVAARRAGAQLARRAGCEGVLLAVFDDVRQGFVATANRVFASSRSPYFAYVAQDAFAGRGWLAAAVAIARTQSAGLVAFNDGKWQGELAAFGLVERQWAAGNYSGPLFHPSYKRHYADTELTILAAAQGKLAYDPNAVVIEVDWEKDRSAVDDEDRAFFRSRAGSGFDGQVMDQRLLSKFA